MKLLRKFFMEDELEENRFSAKYNLGESGGRTRTVAELLLQSNLSEEQISHHFLNIKLNDSPNWGRDDLRDIVASMHPGASRENVLITTGTSEALFLLFRQLQPKSIALAIPAFQLLYEIPLALKAKIIPLPIRWDEKGIPFLNEEEWIEILKKQKPGCLLINNPHNPSGLILSNSFISKLQKLSKELNFSLIGDEHYRFLSHQSEILGPTLYKNDKKIFITGSFIKCFGVPGLRIGWCVGPHKVLSAMQNEKNYTTHTVNPITEWISYEVLKNSNSELFKNIKQEWLENKNILKNLLIKSELLYGTVPDGGLVTALGFKSVNSKKQTKEAILNLKEKGIFALSLDTMEFGKFEFQKESRYLNRINLSGINKGYGVRLGLGCSSKQLWEFGENFKK